MRPMVRILRAVGALLVVLGIVGGSTMAGAVEPTASTEDVATADRVLLVSVPTLRWSDVVELQPPNLMALLERSAVGSMSVRSVGTIADLGRSYATIGAGNRVTTPRAPVEQLYPPDAPYEGGTAGLAFERRCGCDIEDAVAVHVGIAPLHLVNEELLFGAVPGALGEALHGADRVAAAVGNADRGIDASDRDRRRDVGLTVMDTDGRMRRGEIGPALLAEDPDAPFGVRMDLGSTEAAFDSAWSDADLVVLEMSDLARVDSYAQVSTPEAYEAVRADAVSVADDLLGRGLQLIQRELGLSDEEAAAAKAAGLRYVHLPLNSSNPDPAVVDEFLVAIAEPANQPAFIHCASGNRAAAMWMIKRLVVDGWDLDRASTEAAALGLKSSGLRDFVVRYVQTHGE